MKCKNDIYMAKVGVEKINKQTEVHFDVQRDLPDCKKINTSKYLTSGPNARFNRYKAPINQFECLRVGCVNSGTLYNEGAETVFKIHDDATQFSAGVITFYVMPPANEANVTVKLANAPEFTDAWEYDVALADMATGSDGYKAVVIDLSKTPTNVIGNGWVPSETSNFIAIAVVPADPAEDMSGVGISSIFFFDEIADFEISTHVIMACMTSIDGSFDFEVAEATCFGSGNYNTDDMTGFEKTVTGKALTPNYILLNPLAKKSGVVQSSENVTIEKSVAELAGTDYGYITIGDMSQDECGFFSASLADSCNITDAQLFRLSIPSRVDVDEKHYQLVDNGDGSTTVLFNKEHIGDPVHISYPKAVEAEEIIFSEDAIGETRVRMSYQKEHTDGVRYRFVFNNVLITSFPDAVTQDETEFAFTVSIQKDSRGNYGYAYRILD